jgi:PTH1 family peptidyl-tRNA hydrolase
VLQDFPKSDWPVIERMIDAVAEELPLLVAGDDGAFMSKVAHRVNPPRPKPEPKPEGQDGTAKGDGAGASPAPGTSGGAGDMKAALDAARAKFETKKPGGDGV